MSLSLSRRIVQAAFVVAAGAVPAVLTGVAHAAPALPAVPDLGGLSQLDTSGLGSDVQSTTHQTGLPQADQVVGSTAGQLSQVTGSTAAPVSGLTGSTTGANRSIPAGADKAALPAAGSATGALGSLPLGSLPVSSLPVGAASSTLSSVTDPSSAPASQRLGGLPSLGDTSALGSVTQALPLGGGSLPV